MSAAAAPQFSAEGFVDARLDARVLKVLPGECRALHCRGGPGQPVLATTLGSCVSACLFEEGPWGIGGMNHFLLPEGEGRVPDGLPTRYGLAAMESLLNGLLRLGSARGDLVVKLFGGGRMLDNLADVGERNIRFVRAFLHTEGLRVQAADLGGDQARRVNFRTDTGRAQVRRLPMIGSREVASRERRFRRELATARVDGGVELF